MYRLNYNNPINVHFVGIGGISMSGLAEILHDRGFNVTGSDRAKTTITEMLENKGIKIYYGQVKENISADTELVVFTAAISPDNEELVEAKRRGIDCISRADLLGQIMKNYEMPVAVAGTHGKTTTTSMITTILMESDADPTVTVGGMLDIIGGNLRIGRSGVFVTEACEYTNSFLSFFPKVSVILNVEEDHMDFFKDIDDIRSSFKQFAEIPEKDGLVVINAHIDNYEELIKDIKCKYVTFGLLSGADYRASDITYNEYGCARFDILKKDKRITSVKLNVPGQHNVLNALSAVAVADFLGIDMDTVVTGLDRFCGADRRFQYKGRFKDMTIIDDYAHHPTEIKATLNAAKNYPHSRLTVVFQPHTYTRTKAFFYDFADALSLADRIILAEIYAAREKNTIGISSKSLCDELAKRGKEAYYFASFDEIEDFILKNFEKNELLITMGAGNIDEIGNRLLEM